jgi:hypothetical protein
LYFPAIPQKDCTLNIIEKIKENKNDFNFYKVALKIENAIKVK